jgi:hypothetical protein
MRKGCFLKIIVFLTIIIAAAIYFIQNYSDDLIIKPGKKLLSGFIMDKFEGEFDGIKDSPEKDSLKILISDFIQFKIASEKNFDDRDFDFIIFELKKIISDSIITKDELNSFKMIIKN